MPRVALPKPVIGPKARLTPSVKARRKTAACELGDTMENEPIKNSTQPVEFSKIEDYEKTAAPTLSTGQNTAAGAFKSSLYGALGTALVGGLVSAGFAAYDKYQDKKNLSNARRALQQAMQMTPALARYNPATLESYLPMIVKASPTVATEPRLLANYLESMLDAEGHLNLGTFRELSGMENTMLGNSQLSHPYRVNMQAGLAKEMGKNMATGFSNAMRDTFEREFSSTPGVAPGINGLPGNGNVG